MRIAEIRVQGLFGCYDHDIELSDEGLTYIHSLNGVGKSTTLNLIDHFFDGDLTSLRNTKFGTMTITFTDGSSVTVDGSGYVSYEKDGKKTPVGIEDVMSMVKVTYLSADRNMHYIGKELAVSSAGFLMKELDSKVDSGNADKEALDRLVSSLNKLYTNKKAYLDDNGHLKVSLEGHYDIPVDNLSSGEKQVFIMFYTILFAAENGSLVIIDEPEISLHVAWQQKLGRIFLEFCDCKDLQMIIATHSPMIIHDRWDLSREMGIGRA